MCQLNQDSKLRWSVACLLGWNNIFASILLITNNKSYKMWAELGLGGSYFPNPEDYCAMISSLWVPEDAHDDGTAEAGPKNGANHVDWLKVALELSL